MADQPDDEQETFVQKAVKIGLIAIPLMMYVTWAHKKFVPCPKVKQEGSFLFKKCAVECKRGGKKSKRQDSRPAKQECKRRYNDPSHDLAKQEHLKSCAAQNQDAPKNKYIDYLKHSRRECCETESKPVDDCLNETEQQASGTKDCNTQQKQTKPDTLSQLNTQSSTISPEAFDRLFEQHFQKCIDDFKQHTQRFEKENSKLNEIPDNRSKTDDTDKNGSYLACLAELNLDKDFECDRNFHSDNLDAPYVVKDYKCKTAKETNAKAVVSNQEETKRSSYLKCLADLNMDKNMEQTREELDESCPQTRERGNEGSPKNNADVCTPESNTKSKDQDPCEWEIKAEELSNNETQHTEAKPDYDNYDPWFNTKSTDGTNEPFTNRSEREDRTDDDALKDFWHACGPPKGLRTGCREKGCKGPRDNPK